MRRDLFEHIQSLSLRFHNESRSGDLLMRLTADVNRQLAERYQPSRWQYKQHLAPIEYGPDDHVRKVQHSGWISFQGKEYSVAKAFYRQRVALRPTDTDGLYEVYFCNQKIDQIDCKRTMKSVTHVPERV